MRDTKFVSSIRWFMCDKQWQQLRMGKTGAGELCTFATEGDHAKLVHGDNPFIGECILVEIKFINSASVGCNKLVVAQPQLYRAKCIKVQRE